MLPRVVRIELAYQSPRAANLTRNGRLPGAAGTPLRHPFARGTGAVAPRFAWRGWSCQPVGARAGRSRLPAAGGRARLGTAPGKRAGRPLLERDGRRATHRGLSRDDGRQPEVAYDRPAAGRARPGRLYHGAAGL